MDEVKNFFCQFPNPWTLRVSGMGYTSKLGKNQNHCTLVSSLTNPWPNIGWIFPE
jgi:hypothetical protein